MTRKPAPPASARHPTDLVSLIFGLLFLGVAGWWAAAYYLDLMISWSLPDVGWVLAAGLILLGLIGIAASLRRDRQETAAATAGTAEPGAPEAPTGPEAVPPDDEIAQPDRPEPGDPGGHRPA